MWAAQFYKFREPRRWVTSGGLGSMGFGLPSALGAAAAFDGKDGRPAKVVVDIDGDGSFIMNCQELATAAVEGLATKVFILNNQHLGMVVQVGAKNSRGGGRRVESVPQAGTAGWEGATAWRGCTADVAQASGRQHPWQAPWLPGCQQALPQGGRRGRGRGRGRRGRGAAPCWLCGISPACPPWQPFLTLAAPSSPRCLQWEDRFYKGNRAHTYLGRKVRLRPPAAALTHGFQGAAGAASLRAEVPVPGRRQRPPHNVLGSAYRQSADDVLPVLYRFVPQEGDYQESGEEKDIFPDFVTMAAAFGVPAKRVRKPEELR
jgi:hypothetical protein